MMKSQLILKIKSGKGQMLDVNAKIRSMDTDIYAMNHCITEVGVALGQMGGGFILRVSGIYQHQKFAH